MPLQGEHAESRAEGRRHGRPLAQRQSDLVRVLLYALLAALLLVLASHNLALGWAHWTGANDLLLLAVVAVTWLAIIRLRSGHLDQAVWLAVSGTFAILLSETIENGIAAGPPLLFAYSVPVALAGLLLGRRALLLTSVLSIAAVLIVYLFESGGVPWVATRPAAASSLGVVLLFALVIGLLALVLERFGVALKEAHAESMAREQDLSRLIGELEHEIDERRQAEYERSQAERERESLLERERTAREAAESAAAKLSFLAEAGHLLSTSLDLEETLRRLTGLVVPRWADWCALDIKNANGALERLSVAHQDPVRLRLARELQRRYPPGEDSSGAAAAVAQGKTQYFAKVDEELLHSLSQDEEHLQLLRSIGLASAVVVPLVVRGESVGALTLAAAESERSYTPDDVLFFEELATRAAAAVENAGLFAEVRTLNQELEARVSLRTQELSDALSELETFAYSISHDLRTPLRGIDGFSQALLEEYSQVLDDNARQYIGRIRTGASRMGELIDDLLTLSRLSRGEIQRDRVDISELARSVVAHLRSASPGRFVEVEIEPGMSANGDARLLHIVLENLLSNAWKFTRSKSVGRIEVGTSQQEGETIFFVRDNGIGFEMSYADKLFVPFQRLHPATQVEGSGIGLATVQRVLRRHGGRIWAHGTTGEGAVFYFTIAS